MTSPRPRGRVVVGVGQPHRGDDGVGPAVIAALHDRRLPADVAVLCVADGLGLVDALPGNDVAVIVDATCCGGVPGTVRSVPRDALERASFPPSSTHVLGVAEALDLLSTMGDLPPRVVVVGVEGSCFSVGAPVADAVVAAIPAACDAVLAALED